MVLSVANESAMWFPLMWALTFGWPCCVGTILCVVLCMSCVLASASHIAYNCSLRIF